MKGFHMITVTRTDGTEMQINPEYIVSYEPAAGHPEYCVIELITGTITITNSYERFKSRMD